MTSHELLVEPIVHITPAKALEGLSPGDAERHLPGANHSVAEIVAHMMFWQDWLCRRCEGSPDPMAPSASIGWPAVLPGSWPDLQTRFLDGLERAASLGERDAALVSPPIEFPPLAHYTLRDALVHMAQHNAHHLGQVILLRQMMGLWPPPAGSWTW